MLLTFLPNAYEIKIAIPDDKTIGEGNNIKTFTKAVAPAIPVDGSVVLRETRYAIKCLTKYILPTKPAMISSKANTVKLIDVVLVILTF